MNHLKKLTLVSMETKVVSKDSFLGKLSETLYLNGFWKGNRVFAWGGGGAQCAYRRKDDNRRLRVEIAIRAIASEFTIAWQAHLRAKMAIHGSASELNRIKIKTCEWK